MKFVSLSLAALSAATPAAAQTVSGAPATAAVEVTITDAGPGGIRFSCTGDFVKPNCDLDFTGPETASRPVLIDFTISKRSVAGVSFLPVGADAVWIVDKALAGPTGEPTAPYNGGEFAVFAPSAGGKRIQVFNKNDDGKTYQYALRFLLTTAQDGSLVMDPEIKNGGKN